MEHDFNSQSFFYTVETDRSMARRLYIGTKNNKITQRRDIHPF